MTDDDRRLLDVLTPPAGNETGTIYAEIWGRRYGDHPRDPKGRFRRKVRT